VLLHDRWPAAFEAQIRRGFRLERGTAAGEELPPIDIAPLGDGTVPLVEVVLGQ
jgi:hypothetical protein